MRKTVSIIVSAIVWTISAASGGAAHPLYDVSAVAMKLNNRQFRYIALERVNVNKTTKLFKGIYMVQKQINQSMEALAAAKAHGTN